MAFFWQDSPGVQANILPHRSPRLSSAWRPRTWCRPDNRMVMLILQCWSGQLMLMMLTMARTHWSGERAEWRKTPEKKNNWLNSENKTIYLTKRKNAKHLQNNLLNSENFSRRHHHGLLVLSIIVIMDYHNSWQTLSTYLLLFVRWSSHQRRCHWCHCFPGRRLKVQMGRYLINCEFEGTVGKVFMLSFVPRISDRV